MRCGSRLSLCTATSIRYRSRLAACGRLATSLASSGSNGVKLTAGLPVKRQQFRQAIDAVLVDALQNVAQVGVGFHAHQFARFDQAEDDGGGLAAALGGSEQPCLPSDGHWANRTLDQVRSEEHTSELQSPMYL